MDSSSDLSLWDICYKIKHAGGMLNWYEDQIETQKLHLYDTTYQ